MLCVLCSDGFGGLNTGDEQLGLTLKTAETQATINFVVIVWVQDARWSEAQEETQLRR